jgi:hypothetical protein
VIPFLTHLEDSANRLEGWDKIAFVQSFTRENGRQLTREVKLAFPASTILDTACRILTEQEFTTGRGADHRAGVLQATFRREYPRNDGFLGRLRNLTFDDRLTLQFSITAKLVDGGLDIVLTHDLPTWMDSFEAVLKERLAAMPDDEFDPATNGGSQARARGASVADEMPEMPVEEPILGPGQPLDASVRGYFRDYSGFAHKDELKDLDVGDLPLGRYLFKTQKREISGGPLYLSKYRTGAPMLHNGVLVCAPQGSGKTQLIVRWAEAANRLGYSVFVVDMKGNMHDKLKGLQGTVRYFTTDPAVENCDGINFIAGLHGTTPLDSMRVRQVAEALLPQEGWESGENAYFHQNHVNWLSGLLHLVLLFSRVARREFPSGVATLGDVHKVAANYDSLQRLLRNLRAIDGVAPLPAPGLRYWEDEIALLLDPADGGQRASQYTYRTLTQAAVNALQPFSTHGILHEKSGGSVAGGGRPRSLFSLADLENPGTDGPVTIILAARIQDLDAARTVTALAVQRLQHLLFERMTNDDPHPVLLLLDETRRIPGFKANEYVTFAREAKAGCVVSYQSLDQIGDAAQISEMLENVGTQIYLGSLVGATAKYFIDTLPTRHRRRYSWNTSIGGDYSRGVDLGLEEVPYVSSNELYRLPAGKWPALVYINDQPRRKPFLVDLEQTDEDQPRLIRGTVMLNREAP